MIRQEIIGTIYTLNAKIQRQKKSCANITDFSTFDTCTDCYAWSEYGTIRYLVMPAGQKENIISFTVYVLIGRDVRKAQLPELVRNILKEEFVSKVCDVRIVHLGKPRLFLRPHVTVHHADAEPESSSEKIFDMIINA